MEGCNNRGNSRYCRHSVGLPSERNAWSDYDGNFGVVKPDVKELRHSEWGNFGEHQLVGHGRVTNDKCGKFRGFWGCLGERGSHDVVTLDGKNHQGKVYVKKIFRSCDKPTCPVCFKRGWAVREAGNIESRIKEAEKRFGKAEHIVVSVPQKDYGLSYEALQSKAIKARARASLPEIRVGFIRVYEDTMRAKGLPTIMGRIMAVLLLEGRELNHKEISSLTGYSMASVNRTLNQLVSMGIAHKHKDPLQKYYVFHASINFPEIYASSIEKIMNVYQTQRNEINNLTQKLTALESEGKKQTEIKHLRTVLENFDRILEVTMEVLKKTVKELRLLKDTPNS